MATKVISENIVLKLEDGFLKSWLDQVLPEVLSLLWSIVLAFIVFWIGRKIIKLISKVLKKSLSHANVEDGLASFLNSMAKGCLNIILFIIILGLFGVTTSSIAATVAALGLTAGLSLQGALSNFAGGCIILLFHPFKAGDYIIEDNNKNEGFVESITIIYTTIRTLDGRRILIPNGTLAAASITNCSDTNKRMFNEKIGISYSSDIKTAKDILFDIAYHANGLVAPEEIKVFVAELGESTVNIGLRFWIDSDSFWTTKWQTLELIKNRFDEAGVEIAFNQLDVHINNIGNN
ncbi:MAG: mechanosensitive ion channel [Pseudobutyrivibrio sp.]|nr:mechanosensitive ion channel [Pseudobutyrivibrio sp.]